MRAEDNQAENHKNEEQGFHVRIMSRKGRFEVFTSVIVAWKRTPDRHAIPSVRAGRLRHNLLP